MDLYSEAWRIHEGSVSRFVAHCNGVIGSFVLIYVAHLFGGALAGGVPWSTVFWFALIGAISMVFAIRELKK